MVSSKACTDLAYKFNNGAWSTWSSTLTGGYAGPDNNRNHIVVLKFKTPAIESEYTNTRLEITIPYVRQNNATSLKFYMKLYTSDPTSKSLSSLVLNSSNSDITITGGSEDKDVHKLTFDYISAVHGIELKANTVYYLVFDASSYMQIGYLGYDDWYSINLFYNAYTEGGQPTLIITDLKKNKVSFSGTLGKPGTNNARKSSKLYYLLSTKKWNVEVPDGYTAQEYIQEFIDSLTEVPLDNSKDKYEYILDIPNTTKQTYYVSAFTECTFDFNSSSSTGGTKFDVPVTQYVVPTGYKPTIVYPAGKSKLTQNDTITYTWQAAKANKDNSPVSGYEVELYKYVKNINGSNNSGFVRQQKSVLGNDKLNISYQPADYDIIKGDRIHLSLRPYTIMGDIDNTELYSKYYRSSDTTIDSASTFMVKVDGSWEEGQVYVKVDGNWIEAESVYVKANDAWKEAQ